MKVNTSLYKKIIINQDLKITSKMLNSFLRKHMIPKRLRMVQIIKTSIHFQGKDHKISTNYLIKTRLTKIKILKSGLASSFQTGQLIKGNGLDPIPGMDLGFRYGQTAPGTSAGGKIIKLMERGNSFIPMEICMTVNGKMTKLTDLAGIPMQMAHHTKENGPTTNKMVKV